MHQLHIVAECFSDMLSTTQRKKKATTLLCIMVKCIFGGPKFLAKLLPCSGLNAAFQFNCVQELISTLEGCGAEVITTINDNNRTN